MFFWRLGIWWVAVCSDGACCLKVRLSMSCCLSKWFDAVPLSSASILIFRYFHFNLAGPQLYAAWTEERMWQGCAVREHPTQGMQTCVDVFHRQVVPAHVFSNNIPGRPSRRSDRRVFPTSQVARVDDRIDEDFQHPR